MTIAVEFLLNVAWKLGQYNRKYTFLIKVKSSKIMQTKPISNPSLFKLIISDQKLIKLKLFFLSKYLPFKGQKLSVALEQFYFTPKLLG